RRDAEEVVARRGGLEGQAGIAALLVVQGDLPPVIGEDAQQRLQAAAPDQCADLVAHAKSDLVQVHLVWRRQKPARIDRLRRLELQQSCRAQGVPCQQRSRLQPF